MAAITKSQGNETIVRTFAFLKDKLKNQDPARSIGNDALSKRVETIIALMNKDEYAALIDSLEDKEFQKYFNLAGRMAEALGLPDYEKYKNKKIYEGSKYFHFTNGEFYINAADTEITISEIFPTIFLGTNWYNDRDFYTQICQQCLNISDPNKISGEYKVNLKFDGNDETSEDNAFGILMREKYISERFANKGADAAKAGHEELINFDKEHGTQICKSENNNLEISDNVYKELIPEDNKLLEELKELLGINILIILTSLNGKNFFDSVVTATLLYSLAGPYLSLLEKEIKNSAKNLKPYAENWIKYIKKFHVENIDDFDMNDGEIMGFLRAVSVIVNKMPQNLNVVTYEGCFFLQYNSIEEFFEKCYEYGPFEILKNKLIDISVNELKKIDNETLLATVIEVLPDKFVAEHENIFNVEFFSKKLNEACIELSNSKSDLTKLKKTYIHKLLGFTYAGKDKDYYYTEEGSLQSKLGFMDFYDDCGKFIGMDGLQDIVVTFPYNDKEYRVELWYGPYGDGRSYGAEIGIYYRDLSDAMEKPYMQETEKGAQENNSFIYYGCVKDKDDKIADLKKKNKSFNENEIKSDQFVMNMKVFYENEEQYSHTTEGHTGKDDNGDHFWCLAIRSSKLGKGEEKINHRKNLKIIGTIEKKDEPELINVMYKALREAHIEKNKIKVDKKSLTKLEISYGGIYET